MLPADTEPITNHEPDCHCYQCADIEAERLTDTIELTEAGKHFLAVTEAYNRGVDDTRAKFEQLLADAKPNANADAIAFFGAVTKSIALLRRNGIRGPYYITIADDFPHDGAVSTAISYAKRAALEHLLNLYADSCCDNGSDPETSTADRIIDPLARAD